LSEGLVLLTDATNSPCQAARAVEKVEEKYSLSGVLSLRPTGHSLSQLRPTMRGSVRRLALSFGRGYAAREPEMRKPPAMSVLGELCIRV
jgi:hypothetical protein